MSSPSFSRSVLSCSEGHQAQSGESSWTDYFVDFMLSEEERKKHQDANYYSATEGGGGGEDDGDFDGSSREVEEEDSMISDAASRAPADTLFPVRYKGLRKLKKQAFKALGHDDSLEDTASSPVNSPKVSQAINYPSFLVLKLDCMLIYRDVNLALFWVASLRSVLCHSWN